MDLLQNFYDKYSLKVDKVSLSPEQITELCKMEEHNIDEVKGVFVPNISIESFLVDVIDLKHSTITFLFQKIDNPPPHDGESSDEIWTVLGKAQDTVDNFGAIQRTFDGYARMAIDYETFSSEEEGRQMGNMSVLMFAAIQNRLSYTDDFDVEEKKVTTSTKKKKKGKKAYTQHKVRLYKCYTLTRIAPVENLHKKKVVITCPAWGVRGHYRHYKSGKVVFISPYTKGKDRNNYQSKEYGLFRPTKGGKENEINRTDMSAQ